MSKLSTHKQDRTIKTLVIVKKYKIAYKIMQMCSRSALSDNIFRTNWRLNFDKHRFQLQKVSLQCTWHINVLPKRCAEIPFTFFLFFHEIKCNVFSSRTMLEMFTNKNAAPKFITVFCHLTTVKQHSTTIIYNGTNSTVNHHRTTK